MEKAADFAMSDTGQKYCQYCADEKGRLKSWEKILEMNVNYYVESQGITKDAAIKMASEFLISQPAWRK